MTGLQASIRRVPRVVWPILVVAFAVRLLVAAETHLQINPSQDSWDYDRHAKSIARGDGYPRSLLADSDHTAARAPVYPYFLGAVYAITGGEARTARFVQAALGTVTVALVGLLAWELAGTAVALASLGIAAIYPQFVSIDTALLTEALFVPIELAALIAALAHRRSRHRYRWAAVAGILGGLACLARPNGALLLLPLIVALWPARPEVSLRPGRAVAVLLAATCITIAPWTIRNAIVMDSFIPISTESGYVMAGMYNDAARTAERDRGSWVPTQLVPEFRSLFGRRDIEEPELEERLRSAALRYMWDHPGWPAEVALLNASKLLHLSGHERTKGEGTFAIGLEPWLVDAAKYGFYLAGLLALLGLVTPAARRVPSFVWLVPALFATTLLFGGLIRYRAPIDPFIVILAGSAVASAWGWLQQRRVRPR